MQEFPTSTHYRIDPRFIQADKEVRSLLLMSYPPLLKLEKLETIRSTGQLNWHSVDSIKKFKEGLQIFTDIFHRFAELEEDLPSLKLKSGDRFFLLSMVKGYLTTQKCQVHIFGHNHFECGLGFGYKKSDHNQDYPNSLRFKLRQRLGELYLFTEIQYTSFGSRATISTVLPSYAFISFSKYQSSPELQKLLANYL
jgi:hypothetical protein